ncbi:MAG: phospholipase D family protein [bacterium]|nr:phospholipase D family protein [bacterium]MDE0288033.1 phospholipase D family protein [bacterium]
MLVPTNRLTLIDAMRPPAGFELESAMAATFTLNLGALLAVPAAFVMAGLRDTEADDPGQTPVELIHALRSHAHKMTVFSEAGEIGLPPPSRAFAFLEGTVVPVTAPRGGIVHPKVWVLRYKASGDSSDGETQERLRVLIASRNMTFDQSWDTVLRLDETPDGRGAALHPVGELFKRLLGNAVGEVEKEHEDRVRLQHKNRVHSLAEALQAVRFELPAGVDDLRTYVFGLGEQPPPFPGNPERALIVSPFLTDDFFQRVHSAPVDTLVSGQEALDGLSQGVLDSIPNKWVFDDGSPFEHQGSEGGDTESDGYAPPTPSSADPGRPLVGVHAKVFAFETGDRARLFVGSANATGPAFEGNVEILVELRGSVSELGIDRLLDGDGDDPGLRDLFHPYRPRSGEPDDDEPDSSILDRMRCGIARQVFRGCVKETGETGQEWAVTYRSAEPLPAIDDVEIHCWPLTTPGNRRQVGTTEPLEARFETTLEALSGFLAFELTHDSGEQTSFAVPVPLVGVPECRNQVLLKALIGNAERFLRYLLALLYEGSDQIDLREVSTILDRSASDGNGSFSLAVLERLLGTMRRDPLKLAGLHPLIADLRSDDALPPGFAELWDAVHQVAIRGTTEQDARLS